MNIFKFLFCVASVFLFYGTVYAGVSVCVAGSIRGNTPVSGPSGPTTSIYCLASVGPDVATPMFFGKIKNVTCDGYSIYLGHVTHCGKAGADFTLRFQMEVP